jgi:thiol:disulfide interchange protein DsbD
MAGATRAAGPGGEVVGQGYEGETLLPVVITPPDGPVPGTSVDLRVRADWLMCHESCVPGGAELVLSLPVAAGSRGGGAQGVAIRRTMAAIPRTDLAWRVTATTAGAYVQVALEPTGAAAIKPGAIRRSRRNWRPIAARRFRST